MLFARRFTIYRQRRNHHLTSKSPCIDTTHCQMGSRTRNGGTFAHMDGFMIASPCSTPRPSHCFPHPAKSSATALMVFFRCLWPTRWRTRKKSGFSDVYRLFFGWFKGPQFRIEFLDDDTYHRASEFCMQLFGQSFSKEQVSNSTFPQLFRNFFIFFYGHDNLLLSFCACFILTVLTESNVMSRLSRIAPILFLWKAKYSSIIFSTPPNLCPTTGGK